jgi:hypothetical protein
MLGININMFQRLGSTSLFFEPVDFTAVEVQIGRVMVLLELL